MKTNAQDLLRGFLRQRGIKYTGPVEALSPTEARALTENGIVTAEIAAEGVWDKEGMPVGDSIPCRAKYSSSDLHIVFSPDGLNACAVLGADIGAPDGREDSVARKKSPFAKLTREQIVTAINSGKCIMAWLVPGKGALVYDPLPPHRGIHAIPGANAADVMRLAKKHVLDDIVITDGLSGLAFAAGLGSDDGSRLEQVWSAAMERPPAEPTETLKKRMTREDIGRLISDKDVVLAWITDRGAVVWDSSAKSFQVFRGADSEAIKDMVALERTLVLLKGVGGMALAAYRSGRRGGTYRCIDPRCPHGLCEDLNCNAEVWKAADETWGKAENPPFGAS